MKLDAFLSALQDADKGKINGFNVAVDVFNYATGEANREERKVSISKIDTKEGIAVVKLTVEAFITDNVEHVQQINAGGGLALHTDQVLSTVKPVPRESAADAYKRALGNGAD